MTLYEERKTAIHLLRSGQSKEEVAEQLGRSTRWVRKWHKRHQTEGWEGLRDRSRRPHKIARQTREEQKQAICQVRSELEAEASEGKGLKYIGGQAVRTRLKEKGLQSLPSTSTIERVLREAGMTRPYKKAEKSETHYPRLKAKHPQKLVQVDIVPHYLKGGQRAACFNAIDVASRYPTGNTYPKRRSKDAEDFLLQVWKELGVPKYTQVDNEGCFSGGFTHPYVLGKVVRLALEAGTELVFSPVRDPKSNGCVERFHQDFNKHVWEDTYLENISDVQEKSQHFFSLYRQRPHPRLKEQTPLAVHKPPAQQELSLTPTSSRRPLFEGQVHFIRRVTQECTISVLNVRWEVPAAQPGQGVWATLKIRTSGAKLLIFDAAPDAPVRKSLATHPFKLSEDVLSHPTSEIPTFSLSSIFKHVAHALFGGTMS
jgi:transposase